jgi:hypothetical protein
MESQERSQAFWMAEAARAHASARHMKPHSRSEKGRKANSPRTRAQCSPQLIDAGGGVVGDTRKHLRISLQSAEGQGRGENLLLARARPARCQPVGLGGRYGRFDAGEIIPHRIIVL